MRAALRASRVSGAVLLLGAIALWPFPVFQILHVESAAIIAFLAWWCAGLSAVRPGPPWRVMAAHVAWLLLPLAALTLSMLWAPNCAYATGLAFFLIFTVPSVLLAVALGHSIGLSGARRPRTWFAGVTAAIVIGGTAYDLGLHPQFYTFNHVFGGVLGPIYDEDIVVRSPVVWFRLLTVLWAVLILLWARRRRALSTRGLRPGTGTRVATLLVVMVIGAMYFFSARLGINAPAWFIRQELGGHSASDRFDLYHAQSMPVARARALLETYEFHFDRLHATLGVVPGERIAVYAYPDPFTRERLTGARYTNVAPVWLRQPQIHVLANVPESVHAHELVHVFSREFGTPLINASLAVGLIEGLAVALESPSGGPSADDQVAAMLDDPRFDVADVAARLTPVGFWGGRGAVSYASSGSFVSHLLRAYPPEYLRGAYAWGGFRRHFGKSAEMLAMEWEADLRSRPVVSAFAARTAVQRFSVPSLFEVRCPHHVPEHRRRFIDAQRAWHAGDATAAVTSLKRSLLSQPGFVPARLMLADLQLRGGDPESALAVLLEAEASAARDIRLADAFVLLGDAVQAEVHLTIADSLLPRGALETRAWLAVRKATVARSEILGALYGGALPPIDSRRVEESLLLARIALDSDSPGVAVERLRADEPSGASVDARDYLLSRLHAQLLINAALQAGESILARETAAEAWQNARLRGDVDGAALFEHFERRARWQAARSLVALE